MKHSSSISAFVLVIIFVVALCFTPSLIAQWDSQDMDTDNKIDVPDWGKDAVWYQIMIQFFRNGDPKNDPTIDDQEGTWPFEKQTWWQITPWTDDPYKLEPWEKANGKSYYYNWHVRRYGGDFKGMIEKLDYLKDLGINAIYFCPMYEAPAYHMYDTRMYHHASKNFGPDPVGDAKIYKTEDPADSTTWKWTVADKYFVQLIKEAHARGIRIIVDAVLHYVGTTFWDKRIQGRYPVSTPEFRNYMHYVVNKWGDPNGDGDPSDGIDGWRLDMAVEVPKEFWREFRKWVREVNPQAIIVGEMWFNSYKMINSAPWLQGDMFDSHMNYLFGDAVMRAFIDKEKQLKPSELDILLGEVRKDYPREPQFVLQNLIGTHDTERFAGMILRPDQDKYHHPYTIDANLPYSFFIVRDHTYDDAAKQTEKKYFPTESDRQIQKAILTFQFTYLGAPYIYFGDETGTWYGSRNPMVWDDLKYENQHPFGDDFPVDAHVDKDIFNFYKSVVKLRKDYPALRRGSYHTVYMNDEKGIIAFQRSYKNERIRAVFNLSDKSQEVDAIWNYLQPIDPYKQPMGIKTLEWDLIFGDSGDLNNLPAKAARVYRHNYHPDKESQMRF